MSFQHRNYNSELFRPRPEVFYLESPRLLIVATPWGARSSAERAIETIRDYFLSTREDDETTNPFEKMSCLSRIANNLRIATLLTNDWLYREENKSEYVSGVEIFAAAILEQELAFVQSGHPQVLLHREGRGMAPLASSLDLAFDMSAASKLLPPLPNHLLGLDPTLNLTINSFRPQKGDQLVLVSRSSIPSSLFASGSERQELEPMAKLLIQENSQLPFWLGCWNIG